MKHRDLDNVAAAGIALILVLPFALFVVAAGIDLTSWAFTGHELFPWIGHALNGSGNQ